MSILGDLALPLRGFEQELRVILKENVTWDHGYAEPGESYEMTFKGILVDKLRTMAEFEGTRSIADRLLYVRLSQDWVPDLKKDDIVIDKDNCKWKIVERFDYEGLATLKVFCFVRVE